MNDWREEFERAFNQKHGGSHHALAGDKVRSRDCPTCQEDKKFNPKGYYRTYLSEQKCYWNNEMMEDVATFFAAKKIEWEAQAKLEGRKEFLAELGDIYFGTDWIEEPKSAKGRIGALIDLSAARNN